MRISRIYAENFGKFKNINIDLESGINVILGDNEAGKSTIRELLRVVFFGFGPKVKNAKKYQFYPWSNSHEKVILSVHCQGTLENGQSFQIERTLAGNVTGELILDEEHIDIDNKPVPFISHLSEELYRDVYSLTTENTIDFQNIDLIQLERRVLETWGSNVIRTPEEVMENINEKVQKIFKQKYNSSTKLKEIDNRILGLQKRRSELIDYRREYSNTIKNIQDYSDLLLKQNAKAALKKNQLTALEAFMPIFIEESRKDEFGEKFNFERIAQLDKEKAENLFEIGSEIRTIDEEIKVNETFSSATSDDVYSMWHGLFNSFPQDSLIEKATTMDFSESVMIAREGRNLKMSMTSKGGYRIPLGLVMSALGISAIASYYMKLIDWTQFDNNTTLLILGAAGLIGLVGIISSMDSIFTRMSIKKRLKKITDETFEVLADFSPPQKAVETFDEDWFKRLTIVEDLCKKLKSFETRSKDVIERRKELISNFEEISKVENVTSQHSIQDILDDLKGYLAKDKYIRRRRNEIDGAIRTAEISTSRTLEDIKSDILIHYPDLAPLEALETVRREYDEHVQTVNEHNVEIARLKAQINNDSVFNELITIESKIKDLADEREDLKAKRDRLIVLGEFIAVANEKFIGDKKPDFSKRASRMFSHITHDKYNGILIDEEDNILAKSDVNIDSSKISSTATKEQLFMSLKMAVLDDIEKKHESLIVSMDETFAHWDKSRVSNFIELLSEESLKRQYIFYTWDESFIHLLRDKIDGKIIDLNEINHKLPKPYDAIAEAGSFVNRIEMENDREYDQEEVPDEAVEDTIVEEEIVIRKKPGVMLY